MSKGLGFINQLKSNRDNSVASFSIKGVSVYKYLNEAHKILILRTPLLIIPILGRLSSIWVHIFLRGKNKLVNLMFSHCCSIHLRDSPVIPVATVIHLSENPKEPSLEVDCPLILFLLGSGVVVLCTESWREHQGLGCPPYIPGYGKKGQCSELLHSINSWTQHSRLWAHLTPNASRCWEFKQWIERAAWLSADFQPSKLGLWSHRAASNKNQFPLYSKESS